MAISEIKVSYSTNSEFRHQIKGSLDCFQVLIGSWDKNLIELQEEFKIVMLNRANEVLGIYPMSKGGVAGTYVDIKLIFSVALSCNASSIVVSHNHPSGSLKPSEADKKITSKIKRAGEILDVSLLDHVIISKLGYFSFADEGLM